MTSSKHLLPASSVVIAEVNKIKLGIGEIDSLIRDVQCQSIRPVDFRVDDRRASCTVHSNSFDSWILSPISPEQPTSAALKTLNAHLQPA